MYIMTVTSKGQIIIPSILRRHLGIKRGTKVCFIEQHNGLMLKPVTDDYIDSIKGTLKTSGKALKMLEQEKGRERLL